MRNKKGFTMVELLVVLVIVAILAAVATPIYLANVKRARASEAVATMSLIRQSLRDHRVNGGEFFDIATGATANGSITDPLPTSVTANIPTPATSGVDIDDSVTKYFAHTAFVVDATTPDPQALDPAGNDLFVDPDVVDFLITAIGELPAAPAAYGDNIICESGVTDTNCATKPGEVGSAAGGYVLEMDNSGRIFVCYDWIGSYPVGTCGTGDDEWTAY